MISANMSTVQHAAKSQFNTTEKEKVLKNKHT